MSAHDADLPIDMVPIDKLRLDGGTQSRVSIDQAVIAEYADALRAGDTLPPVVVFFDGADFWLADGFHRYHAHAQIEALEIPAIVHTGVLDDAVLYAAGANDTHGLRRTNADKRNAVKMVLAVPRCADWSDHQIARQCGVSQPFVGTVRASLITVISDKPAERTYTTKHGTTATMKTAKIGKTRKDAAPAAPVKANDSVKTIEPPPEVATPRLTPEQGAVAVVDVAAVLQENTDLRKQLAERDEQLAELKADAAELLAENEQMNRVVDADDQLKAAMAEVARYKALCENAERSLSARSHEFNERARLVTYWKNRAEKAEKLLDKAA